MARPTKLSQEIITAITDAIKDGATYQAAAEAAGIAYSTFNEWMKDKRDEYIKFSEAVRTANAEARIILLRRIKKAGLKDWRANAWMLERRFPEEYGNKVDVTSGGVSWLEIIKQAQDNAKDKTDTE